MNIKKIQPKGIKSSAECSDPLVKPGKLIVKIKGILSNFKLGNLGGR